MMNTVQIDGEDVACKRGIYETDFCYAVLKPEQHTIGDSIVVLNNINDPNNHRVDITDNKITSEELSEFIKAINIVATRIKNIAKNECERPRRIYVGLLGDGVSIQHLHAHLIPRYPFTKYDEAKYRECFLQRDGEIEIQNKIKKKDLGGYWYIFDKEQSFYKSEYWQMNTRDKVSFLEDLANKLRLVDP